MQVKGFNHITLNVRNLEKTLMFYTQILGMRLRHRGRKDAYLEWGSAWICIIEQSEFVKIGQGCLGVDHVAFFIEGEHFGEAVNILINHDVKIVRGPIERGTGKTINFLDPNGIQFELHSATLEDRMKVWK